MKNGDTSQSRTRADAYTVQSVVAACRILREFDVADRELTLNEVAQRCSMTAPRAFRLLFTLVQSGMLERTGRGQYRLSRARRTRRKYRIGYASQSSEFSFSRLVSDSIHCHATEAGIELVVLDNRYSSKAALANAQKFVSERVDLVIEFQTDEHSAPAVAATLIDAGIPIIAIDIPHPGAFYYGANNFRAGVMAGRHAAQMCLQEWNGKIDEVLLLELAMAGPLPRSRLTGMMEGIQAVLPGFSPSMVRFLDGTGRFEKSMEVVRKHLRTSGARHVLLGAVNDPSCLGGLNAFIEAGRGDRCIAVGQNAILEARQEMRKPGTRMMGSVAYFPEEYGEGVVSLAIDIIEKRDVAPALFVKHKLITPANVDKYYPNDELISNKGLDPLLFTR